MIQANNDNQIHAPNVIQNGAANDANEDDRLSNQESFVNPENQNENQNDQSSLQINNEQILSDNGL